jgi:hypothetical protein
LPGRCDRRRRLWRSSQNTPSTHSSGWASLQCSKRRGFKKEVEHIVPANGAFIRPCLPVRWPDPPEVIAVPQNGSSCVWWDAYHVTSLRIRQGSHDCCACTQAQRSQHPHPEVHIPDRGTAVAGEIAALGPYLDANRPAPTSYGRVLKFAMMDRKAAVSCVHRHRHRCHQHTALPPSASTTGTEEDARVSVPITGRESLRQGVTVVTQVIVPQAGRIRAALK